MISQDDLAYLYMGTINERSDLKAKAKNTTTLPPGNEVPGNEVRGNPNFAVIVAQRDWCEQSMPKQEPKHPELKRNEVFLMNVTPAEFAWFASGNVHMDDFKKVRLGTVAYKTCSLTKADTKLGYRPMFGALRRGARLRRKDDKETKKAVKKEAKENKAKAKIKKQK